MLSQLASWTAQVDTLLAYLLPPLAVAILISGVDDIVLDLFCLYHFVRSRFSARPSTTDPRTIPRKRVAIYVPCWRESEVIGRMIEHNLAAIDYKPYDFFIGAYPNDDPTIAVIRELESRFPQVHLAVCPHPGPTSKADCLNWVYQRMLLFEEERGVRFDVLMTHDAEDLIHPDSLLTINLHIGTYDMVQIPVLPLPTPIWKLTHGVYCDEFSEFQLKDMPARAAMGSFTPSNGVGTGFSRESMENLASAETNRIFEPACLTEDYENGIRLHRLGCKQLFVPLAPGGKGFVATREYFPSTRSTAIRQRTRWITGIALQTWERHGWKGTWADVYWFWRDRKGLLANPLSFSTNVLFAAGLVSFAVAHGAGRPWTLPQRINPALVAASLVLQIVHTGIRMTATARTYGWLFALGVPLRIVWANYINAAASVRAISRYAQARLRHEPLVWVKTEHAYPSRSSLFEHKRKLSEILAGCGYIDAEALQAAIATKPPGMRLGEHLVHSGAITHRELYEALALQQGLPAGDLRPEEIRAVIARGLPRQIIQEWKVLPYRVEAEKLFLASPEIPSDTLTTALRAFTNKTLQFRLITPANFEELTRTLVGEAPS